MTIQDRNQMGLQGAANRAIESGQSPTNNREFQARFLELVQNEFLTRGAFMQKWMDPRRDINKECGYPESHEVTADKWQEYYERHSIAARVVELMPLECWQITPEVFEDDDPNNTTPFEQAFKDLASHLRGPQSHYKAEEEIVHPIWEACRRLDVLSGVGHYGLMLLGIDDGLSLNQPVEGWQEAEIDNITWNEEALPFLYEQLGKRISINAKGELTFDEEEDDGKPNGKPGKKKKKKSTRSKVKQGYNITEPEVFDQEGTSTPSPQAFGNQNPQQGFHRDPMDTERYKDPKPQGPDQPEYGAKQTTDLQPFKEEEEVVEEQPVQAPQGRKLLYVRVFPESVVQIIRYETNVNSPRFGQPTMYRITVNDPMQMQVGIGMPMSTLEVHYSRVVHIADVGANAVSSEIFAAPRMRPVLNHLIDLQKILGACGEGYWKNAFATLAAETHPQLGGDVTIDSAELRGQMKAWRDSLDRVLAATGVTWRTIAPQIVDPNSHVQNQLNAICIKLGCPLRVFMGSEIGQLASGQDAIAWNFRVKERRKNYLTPRVIVPLIDRLIQIGCLPAPQEGFTVSWNDEQQLMPQEQAQIGATVTQAISTYIMGQCDQFIEPITWLVEVMGWDRDRAKAVVQTTMEHIQRQQDAQAMQMMAQGGGFPQEGGMDEQGQFGVMGEGGPDMGEGEFGEELSPEEEQAMLQQQEAEAMQQQQAGMPGQQAGMSGGAGGPTPGPLGAETDQAAQIGFFADKPQVPYGEDPAEWGDLVEEQGNVEPGAEEVGAGDQQAVEGEEVTEPGELEQQDQEAVAGGQVDEETGLPIDPETGYLVDQESGYLVDKETGDVIDPQSGSVIGNVYDDEGGQEDVEQGELEEQGLGADQEADEEVEGDEQAQIPEGEVEPEQGQVQGEGGYEGDESDLSQFPVDPETGRHIISEDGYQLDPETGDVYDAEGEAIGNLRDMQ